jgi:hypothetical protein
MRRGIIDTGDETPASVKRSPSFISTAKRED